MGTEAKDLSKEEIEKFITDYITVYRRVLEEEFPERKEEFALYKEYPFEVRIYLSDTGITIVYLPNKPELKIDIKRVDKLPSIHGVMYESMIYPFFLRSLNNPEEKARRDISLYFEYEELKKLEEERLSEEAKEYLAVYLKELELEIKPYLTYISSTQKVLEKTKNKKTNEILHTLYLRDRELELIHTYIECEASSLFDTLFDSENILFSSIYLATIGLYIPAIALLRQYLEIKIKAIFFDSELKRHNKNSRAYADIQKKKEKWISKGERFIFRGEYGILERLLDPDSDHYAVEIMKARYKNFDKKTYKKYIEGIYSYTSSFVHYAGNRKDIGLESLSFVEYNEKLFDEWYMKFIMVVEIFGVLFLLKFPKAIELKEKEQKYEIPELSVNQIEKIKGFIAST